MQFLLMIMSEEGRWGGLPEAKRAEVIRGHGLFGSEPTAQGKLIASRRRCPTSMAKTVRVQDDGERIVQDGPFSETKEVLGGFYMIECESQKEAVEWAKKLPIAYDAIEVRPIFQE